MKIKSLSIMQPWIDLICLGHKTIETRKWNTRYRGRLLLCSSLTYHFAFRHIITKTPVGYDPILENLIKGHALATATLTDCRLMRRSDQKDALCKFRSGVYSWILENVQLIKPFEVKGMPGLFDVEIQIEQLS